MNIAMVVGSHEYSNGGRKPWIFKAMVVGSNEYLKQ